jgi:DNA-binding LytR/AlgR family response regulator
MRRPTALIADDEPLLRDELAALLAQAWPELEVVAQARNGREAVERFEALTPDICFLDVHMPGISGVEAARLIGRRAQLVFVTAFDQYALKAFERGALDYLVKPVQPLRLAETVSRLQERLRDAAPGPGTEALLQQLAAQLQQVARAAPAAPATPSSTPAAPDAAPLRWIRATVGQTLRLIPVDEIDFLKSDEKYTLVAWRGDGGQPGEALIRSSLKELMTQLDPEQFVQVHRSVVVNLRAVSHVRRGLNETADIHLRGRNEVLPVSRTFLHLFKQM